MKIFSWVHRRFNNRAENVKKNGDVSAEEDKCNDVAYELWVGGILTIGTFGYDPLKHENEDNYYIKDYFTEEDDDEDDDVSSQLEEQNPLVVETRGYGADELTEKEMEGNWSEEEQVQLGYEYMMMKKKERTTLLDLFSADCDQNMKGINSKKEELDKPDYTVKGKSNRKAFGNKLEARPIQKLNKLMRRMLKRKIHPDVGPTNSKAEVIDNNNNNNNTNNRRTTEGYALLLPATDTNI